MNLRKTAPLASILFLAACGKSGPGGTPSPEIHAQGGTIVVFGEPEGVGFGVDLYSSASGPLFALPPIDGQCRVTPVTSLATETVTVTDLDLGSTVSISDGTETVTAAVGGGGYGLRLTSAQIDPLLVSHQGPLFQYFNALAAPNVFGKSWTVFNSGSKGVPANYLAFVTIPGQVVQSPVAASGQITPGSPFALGWTGGEGAGTFHVTASGDTGSADCFLDGTASSIVLPAEVTSQLGTSAFAAVSAETWKIEEIEGSEVLVVVGSDNLD